MHTVGKRRVDGDALADQGPLARTAALLRGETILRTREHLSRKTSSGSAER